MTLHIENGRLGDTAVVTCNGAILAGEGALRLREGVMALSQRHILLDLSAVSGIDAGGLGALVYLEQWARNRGADLLLLNVPGFVMEVLELTHLDMVLRICTLEGIEAQPYPLHAA